MKNIPIILTTIALLTLAMPQVLAGTDSDQYMTAGGVFTDATGGFTLFACPDSDAHCDFLGDGGRDIPWGIGAVTLRNPDGPVQNLIVSSSDDVFGADAALFACVYNPDGDPTVCGPTEDVTSDVTCGTAVLLGIPWLSDSTLVGVWSLYVSDDLDVCGATTGTATADFF